MDAPRLDASRTCRKSFEAERSAGALLRRKCAHAVSRRWIDAYGLGRSDLLGRSHYNVHPDIPERWREIHQRVLKGEFHSDDDDFWVDADGRDHWVRWASYPWIDAAGEIGGV